MCNVYIEKTEGSYHLFEGKVLIQPTADSDDVEVALLALLCLLVHQSTNILQ